MGQAGYQRLQDNFTFRHFKERLSSILLQELRSKVVRKAAADSTKTGRAAL
jgi:hypothetical protein